MMKSWKSTNFVRDRRNI